MRKLIMLSSLTGIIVISLFAYLFIYLPSLSAGDVYPQLYIRPDGSLEPSSLPINRDGNVYTLKADIELERMFIEKSNLTLDGNGFSIRIVSPHISKGGPELGSFELSNVENVTLRNLDVLYPANDFPENTSAASLTIKNSSHCESVDNRFHSILINNCNSVLVSKNDISTMYRNGGTIQLTDSTNCTISSNTLVGPIILINSHQNKILNNNMTQMKIMALQIEDSENNLLFGNRIEQTQKLFEITGSSATNLFAGNYIQGAFSFPPTLECSGTNTFYHNNFINVYWNITETATANLWDNGSEGNYWNTYQGEDANGDGVGDTPHPVDVNNQDRYPLTNPLDLKTEPQPPLPQP